MAELLVIKKVTVFMLCLSVCLNFLLFNLFTLCLNIYQCNLKNSVLLSSTSLKYIYSLHFIFTLFMLLKYFLQNIPTCLSYYSVFLRPLSKVTFILHSSFPPFYFFAVPPPFPCSDLSPWE